MNSQEALEKLQLYKESEGQSYEYKSDVFHVNRVVAAPRDFHVFNNTYQDYIDNSEEMVKLALSNDYDIFFFDDQAEEFLRLDAFVNGCVVIP